MTKRFDLYLLETPISLSNKIVVKNLYPNTHWADVIHKRIEFRNIWDKIKTFYSNTDTPITRNDTPERIWRKATEAFIKKADKTLLANTVIDLFANNKDDSDAIKKIKSLNGNGVTLKKFLKASLLDKKRLMRYLVAGGISTAVAIIKYDLLQSILQ